MQKVITQLDKLDAKVDQFAYSMFAKRYGATNVEWFNGTFFFSITPLTKEPVLKALGDWASEYDHKLVFSNLGLDTMAMDII